MNLNLGKIGIIGDSYSTFFGTLSDSSWCNYYGINDNVINGVDTIDKTWWKRLANLTNSTIIQNCSYSGSTISYTNYNGLINKETSFIERTRKYFNGEIYYDTILVFGGTNDCWSNNPIGEEKFDDISENDLENFYPACSYLVNYLKEHNKKSKIIFLINTNTFGVNEEKNSIIRKCCSHFNVDFIDIYDIDVDNGHPTVKGMEHIANSIIDYFGKEKK